MTEQTPWFWWHWHNENERRRGADGRTPHGLPWHGRAWAHFARGKWEAHVEWVFLFTLSTGLSFHRDEEGSHWHFGLPGVSLFWGCRMPWSWSPKASRDARELSLRVFDWAIWWKMWAPRDSWSSGTPRWRDGRFRPLDALLGKVTYTDRPLAWRWVAVPMPERTYYGCAKLYESTWKRPRWFASRLTRCEIKMLPGEQIPCPGKGENSWDCGDDATFGLCCPARTIDAAIGDLVATSLGNRSKRGGHDWAPREAVAAE